MSSRNKLKLFMEGDIIMELLSIVALLSLYKFLDTPSEQKDVVVEDYYMDESEYCE